MARATRAGSVNDATLKTSAAINKRLNDVRFDMVQYPFQDDLMGLGRRPTASTTREAWEDVGT